MGKKLASIIIALSSIALCAPVYAEHAIYKIKYSQDTQQNLSPSLAQTTLNLRLYAYGYPRGLVKPTTNEQGEFNFKHPLNNQIVVELTSIEGQKPQTSCYGVAPLGETKLIVKCFESPM